MQAPTHEEIWEVLETVRDPEIPVVSVVEMGMIRSVGVEGGSIYVSLSPTFVGCPALNLIRDEIVARLKDAGAQEVRVRLTLAPPWTSDWIAPQARQKLEEFGLAPPPLHAGRIEAALLEAVPCPFCGSTETEPVNFFGSTLCRAIYRCGRCRQPFEQFKPL